MFSFAEPPQLIGEEKSARFGGGAQLIFLRVTQGCVVLCGITSCDGTKENFPFSLSTEKDDSSEVAGRG